MKRTKLVFTGKEHLELRQEEIPLLDSGCILLETTRSLISSGTERTVFTRNFAPGSHWDLWVQYPFDPGYLLTGTVLDVGAKVKTFKPGDRVAVRASHASHHVLASGEDPQHASSAGDDAPSASVNTARPHLIPAGVSNEEAIWMGLGKITQVGVRAAEHQLGDAVVVVGLGLLGQLVVQYARLSGAREVIGIDTVPLRLKLAQQLGATRTLQSTAADALPAVRKITGGRGADVVYEVTGHPAVFASALPLARKFGTFILLGDAGTPAQQNLTSDVITRGLRIIGAHDGHSPVLATDRDLWTTYAMEELVLTYMARKQLQATGLVTHRFKPTDAAEAYRTLTAKGTDVMGILFEWN